MPNVNTVILAGHMTRDIELRYTPSGDAVGEFGLAINEGPKDKQTTVFVDVTAWRQSAEFLSQYAGKGSAVLVEGKLKYDTWEKDGQKRSKLSVTAFRVNLLGSSNGHGAEPKEAAKSGSFEADPDDTMPF